MNEYTQVFDVTFTPIDNNRFLVKQNNDYKIVSYLELTKILSDLWNSNKKYKQAQRELYESGFFGGFGGFQYNVAKRCQAHYNKLTKLILTF